MGQFNPAGLVTETLAEEAVKYHYFDDKGREKTPKKVLQEVTKSIWKDATEEEKGNIPFLIERIAKEINENYTVKSRDRRAKLD